MADTPIFIHSLFRSGSTYLFNTFRRMEQQYWCYQEPYNEFLHNLDNNSDALLQVAGETQRSLRHPTLSRPYYWEFFQIRDALTGLFRKSFSYDDFFESSDADLDPEQIRYLDALIDNARRRPVLQFCRSTGRIAALKRTFGGNHIHLWREPRTQWWSYKVNDFFDATIHLIYNANPLPPVLADIKRQCGIVDYHDDDVENEFVHARANPLPSPQNYLAFYAFWLHSYLDGQAHANLTINIDRLCYDPRYVSEIKKCLSTVGNIDDIDFSDCSVPMFRFEENENDFYREIEKRVFNAFSLHGYDKRQLASIYNLMEQLRKFRNETHLNMPREAFVARQSTLQLLNRLAVAGTASRRANAVALEAETLLRAATHDRDRAEERAQRAERRAAEAEANVVKLRNNNSMFTTDDHHHWQSEDACALELKEIYKSRSWRITAPMRRAMSLMHSLRVHLRNKTNRRTVAR